MFGQPGDSLLGLAVTLAAFKAKRFGDDAHGEGSHLLGHLRHDRGGAGAGSAAHAGGDEHQISALEGLLQLCPGFLGGLLADHRIATGPQAAGELLTQLGAVVGGGLEQGLGIGVKHPITHALQVGRDHAVDRIAATTPHADHLNPS